MVRNRTGCKLVLITKGLFAYGLSIGTKTSNLI